MAEDSANPPSRIFISYRRDDSEWAVVALNDKLRDHFGDRVFKDTDNIAPGQDFERVINQELQSCSVMLAVIGKDWLTARDPKSQARRLDDPRDTLRLEIATALRNEHVLVIPVLVKGAAMPATADLPADLEPLSRRNAVQLSGGASWNADVERLIRAIERATGIGAAPAPPVAGPAVDPPPVAAPEPTAEDFEVIESRRNRQIAEHLRAAREAFESEDYEATLRACERAVFLDPHEPEVRTIARRARTALDERRIDGCLVKAEEILNRAAVADSDFTTASDLIDQALAINPVHGPATALRQRVLAVRHRKERQREIDRQIQSALDRAAGSLEEHDYDSAIAYCDDALMLSEDSVVARTLRSQAVAARDEERREREHRRRGEPVVTHVDQPPPPEVAPNPPEAVVVGSVQPVPAPIPIEAALAATGVPVQTSTGAEGEPETRHKEEVPGREREAEAPRRRRVALKAALAVTALTAIATAGVLLWPSLRPSSPASSAAPTAATPPQKAPTFSIKGDLIRTASVAALAAECDSGNAETCTELGRRNYYGRGVPKSVSRAFGYHQRGCEGGDPQACSHLGAMYLNGWGVAKDEAKAIDLYRRACDGRAVDGCVGLGAAYETGTGVTKDLEQAKRLFEQMCDGGSASGCNRLGLLYRNGKGVPVDHARALELYKRACEGGSAPGCMNWGVIYENGYGVAKDLPRALDLFERSCQAGYATACVRGGTALFVGRRVGRDAPRALRLFQRGCEQDTEAAGQACAWAGGFHERGEATKRDVARAAELYDRSCTLESIEGCEAKDRLSQKATKDPAKK